MRETSVRAKIFHGILGMLGWVVVREAVMSGGKAITGGVTGSCPRGEISRICLGPRGSTGGGRVPSTDFTDFTDGAGAQAEEGH